MLANDGWKIALHYHSSEKEAYQLAKSLLPFVDVILFKADLTKTEAVANLVAQVNQQLGPIKLLINNASIHKNDQLANLTNEVLQQHLQIHLQAPIFLAKAMAEQGIDGNIINIIDSDTSKNMLKFFSYSLSKKALVDLTKMLAVSLAPHIRVNAISPGAMLFKEGQNIELFNQFIADSPLKTQPALKDLYQTIMFLINTDSVTGQCIFLDSGKYLL